MIILYNFIFNSTKPMKQLIALIAAYENVIRKNPLKINKMVMAFGIFCIGDAISQFVVDSYHKHNMKRMVSGEI